MEVVSPYSTRVVFLAQLVIITAYSLCAAVNTTIRNATIWVSLSLSYCSEMCVHLNIQQAGADEELVLVLKRKNAQPSHYYVVFFWGFFPEVKECFIGDHTEVATFGLMFFRFWANLRWLTKISRLIDSFLQLKILVGSHTVYLCCILSGNIKQAIFD